MVTGTGRYTEEAWIAAKKQAEQTNRPVARILDYGRVGSKLAERHSKPGSERLESMHLYNLIEGQWNGPWNLSFPGELQRYLQKRDDRGRLIYSLGPPPERPAHVQPEAEGVSERMPDEPLRSGRRRHHRGRRRPKHGDEHEA